jgi:4-hydroxy-tetrahydrodipicolinate reductase
MNIALIGYGKMGHAIAGIARERGHHIVLTIDIDNLADFTVENLRKAEVAIEFTRPDIAFDNVKKCLEAGIPVVSGSTGWADRLPEAEALCKKYNGSLIWSSNYSVGVNIFMQINKMLARSMSPYAEYNVEMQEVHHIHKLDKPSGTAITLAEGIFEQNPRKSKWELDAESSDEVLKIESIRRGEVPGIHSVRWFSPVDEIVITHSANNRQGLAHGAVLASEYIHDKKGIFTMEDVMMFK